MTTTQLTKFYLDKYQSTFLKGFAIIIILLHNFFHWLPPKIGEQEMTYSSKVTLAFFNALGEYPEKFLHIFISYTGYIAISLFVLLSGYGLAQKYKKTGISLTHLIFKQIMKVYKLYFVSVAVFCLFCLYQQISIPWTEILLCLSLLNNFFPQDIFLLNGPWWFFSLIIQLYLVFPLLIRALQKKPQNFVFILIGYYIFAYFITFYFDINTTYLYANFLGHLPEFALGIFLSLSPKISKRTNIAFIPLTILFGLSLTTSILHPFSFLLGAIVLLMLGNELYHIMNKHLTSCFYFMGIISPFLFGIHGFLRKYFMQSIPDKMNGYLCCWACVKWASVCILIATLLTYYKKLFKIVKPTSK